MTTGDPRVSAIIIFLNEERFLREAVESVLAQSYRDWELILVDDGSTDGSTTIARSYAVREPDRIRYLEHDGHANRGMSASRNLGLDHARGSYVGFLDADDVWMPDKLGAQVAVLEAHPDVDMVYGRTLLWHSWRPDSDPAMDEYCALGVEPDSVIEPPRLLVSLIDNRAQTPTTCNALMRMQAVARIGRFEEAFRGMFEDQVFFMKIALEAKVFVSSATWARYRQRDDSCSAQTRSSGTARQMRLRLLDWLADYLRRRDVRQRPVWRALRKQRFAAQWPVAYGLYARGARLRRLLLRNVTH